MTVKEWKEFDKVFDNFHESLDNAIDAIEDFRKMDITKTSEPTLETQRDEEAEARWRASSRERQVDMNGDVYIREDEDYLDRD